MDHATPTRGNFVFGLVFLCAVAALMGFRTCSGGGDIAAADLAAFGDGLTLEAAKERSAASGRPVLVYATASWCGPCRAFKANTLSREDVAGAILASFEPVYLDIDVEGGAARDLRVRAVPTVMVLRDGVQVDRFEGAMGTGEFLGFLERNAGAAGDGGE
jgi:thiol-disulfide isomerase/thioredoxin